MEQWNTVLGTGASAQGKGWGKAGILTGEKLMIGSWEDALVQFWRNELDCDIQEQIWHKQALSELSIASVLFVLQHIVYEAQEKRGCGTFWFTPLSKTHQGGHYPPGFNNIIEQIDSISLIFCHLFALKPRLFILFHIYYCILICQWHLETNTTTPSHTQSK